MQAGFLAKIVNQIGKKMERKKVAHKLFFHAIGQIFKYQSQGLNRQKEQQRRLRQIEKGMLKI